MQLRQRYDFYNKLRQARPKLSLVAPLTHKIIIGFIFFNVWIAYAIHRQEASQLLIVRGVFNKDVWAVIFISVSIWLAIALYLNEWNLIRWAMGLELFIKVLWTYALIMLGFKSGFYQLTAILALWGFSAWVQAVTILYFIPSGEHRVGSPTQ